MCAQRRKAKVGIVVRHFIVGFCSACLLVAASSAKADDQSIIAQGQEELRKAADALRPHPSSETTPADFTIAGVHYRVPRNYIVTMDKWAGGPQEVVTLRVTIPDLKPLDAGTSACLLAKPVERPPEPAGHASSVRIGTLRRWPRRRAWRRVP
jgi:hypothetical protein